MHQYFLCPPQSYNSVLPQRASKPNVPNVLSDWGADTDWFVDANDGGKSVEDPTMVTLGRLSRDLTVENKIGENAEAAKSRDMLGAGEDSNNSWDLDEMMKKSKDGCNDAGP